MIPYLDPVAGGWGPCPTLFPANQGPAYTLLFESSVPGVLIESRQTVASSLSTHSLGAGMISNLDNIVTATAAPHIPSEYSVIAKT